MPRTVRKYNRAGRSQTGSSDYAQLLLRESVNVLIKTGHSPEQLRRQFEQICRDLPEPDCGFDPLAVRYVAALPHVIAYWYGDAAYVDQKGQPLPLPFRARGKAPSLVALIRRVFPGTDPDEVLRSLLLANAIIKRGKRYYPKDRYVSLSKHPLGVQVHGLGSAIGLLRTVSHNSATEHLADRLPEFASSNLNIPVRALPEIHKQLRAKLIPLIWKIDELHRRREVKPGSEPTVRLKVGIYVSEDPIVTGVSPRPEKPNRVKRMTRHGPSS